MLYNAQKYGFKMFSKQNWTAEEGSLTKVLFTTWSVSVDYWQASVQWMWTTAMIESHTRSSL